MMTTKLSNFGLALALAILLVAETISALEATQAAGLIEESQDEKTTLSEAEPVDELGELADEVEPDVEARAELTKWLRLVSELKVSHCEEDYFRSLVDFRKRYLRSSLAEYLSDVIRSQRKWCEDYLEREMKVRTDRLCEKTRHYYDLFSRHDHIGEDFYIIPDNSITKLRSMAESEGALDQTTFRARFGEHLFEACREINAQMDGLEPIRRAYQMFARLPTASLKQFRINKFCHNLVNFDLLDAINENLFYDVRMRSELIKFGRYLSEADTSPEQVSQAALAYAVDFEFWARPEAEGENPSIKRRLSAIRFLLRSLKSNCRSGLNMLQNFNWLIQYAGMNPDLLVPAGEESRVSRLHKYLKTMRACANIIELDINKLIQQQRGKLMENQRRRSFHTRLVGGLVRKLGLAQRN